MTVTSVGIALVAALAVGAFARPPSAATPRGEIFPLFATRSRAAPPGLMVPR